MKPFIKVLISNPLEVHLVESFLSPHQQNPCRPMNTCENINAIID